MAVIIEDFLTFKQRNQGRGARTAAAYGDALRRLQLFLDGRDLLSAQPDELEMFCGPWLHKQGVMAVARRPYIAAVREFFKWARHTKRARDNPAAGLSYPKTGRKLPRVLSLTNAERLMWAPDFNTFRGVRDAAILSVLIGCGLRISGLTGLNQRNLAGVEHQGQVRMVIKTREKGDKERLVPVPREAEMVLRLYLEHPELKDIDRTLPDGDQVLFVSTGNRSIPPHEYIGEARRMHPRSIRDMIRQYGKAAGVPVEQLHPHAMRHLFGTELAESDVDLLVRQDLMGHEDVKHTKIYTHLATRKKLEDLDRGGPLAKIRTPVSELLSRLNK
ncbi:tyrosine-type recombinase/integrase [Propionivibrio sp.]|uniref:tyrosine-type recombinase/integrase n=1 Tax=Propionivibrio sp. TaxID=2212460 RepID=UPI0039E4EA6C